MYALSRGLKWKKLGKVLGMIFAVFAGFASFGIGCATQVNAIANVVEENTGVQGWIVRSGRSNTHSNRYFWRNQIYRYSM